MKKSIRKFLEFNGKTITFLSKDGENWVAIKPICEALGVYYHRQQKNIRNDEMLGQLWSNQTMVGADNKLRKMFSLPERYLYGWLYSIKSNSPELTAYKRECYDILYNHFHGIIGNRREVISEQIQLKQQIADAEKALQLVPEYQQLNDLKAGLMRTGKTLKDLDTVLIAEQLQLFN